MLLLLLHNPDCAPHVFLFICMYSPISAPPQHPLLIIHLQPIVTELLLGGRHRWRCAPEPFKLHIIHQKIPGLHQFVDLLQELLFLLSVLAGLVVVCSTQQRRTESCVRSHTHTHTHCCIKNDREVVGLRGGWGKQPLCFLRSQ